MTRKDYILIADAIKATQARISENRKSAADYMEQLRGVRRTAAHLAAAPPRTSPTRSARTTRASTPGAS